MMSIGLIDRWVIEVRIDYNVKIVLTTLINTYVNKNWLRDTMSVTIFQFQHFSPHDDIKISCTITILGLNNSCLKEVDS